MHRNKKLKKLYTNQYQQIVSMISMISSLGESTLYMNFQNFRGRKDTESKLMAMAIIAYLAEKTLGMKPYPVQVMGALALTDGHIAEMQTGEGKTLTSAMAIAWQALHHGAHVMTANDYLAKRDCIQLEPLYQALGLSSSWLENGFVRDEREFIYRSDIVYGSSSQFIFDYLRDQMVFDLSERVQKEVGYLIIDEVDSILIDEARTPMIISGQGIGDLNIWEISKNIVDQLSFEKEVECNLTQLQKLSISSAPTSKDILVNIHRKTLSFTEKGMDRLEELSIEQGLVSNKADLWLPEYAHLVRAFTASSKARFCFLCGHDYVIRGDEAVIVDPDSGRLSKGKRWNDGIHQAIEAKEGLSIKAETVELGRMSIASYVALYPLTAGMTGTAEPVAEELRSLYGKKVVVIPTNKPSRRIRHDDLLLRSQSSKYERIAHDVRLMNARGQPVLIGTGSVEESEMLSSLFNQWGISHKVLNAKQDEDEALIIAQAGRSGAVTIATSMAGRGTDIMLGGNPDMTPEGVNPDDIQHDKEKVIQAGGLFVIGTQRLESRRLDLQLEGRSGRQGDPGASRFYLSLDDPLMQEFGAQTMKRLFDTLGVDNDDSIEHPMINRSIRGMQMRKQEQHAESRKKGMKQDSVIDQPRKLIYKIRNDILSTDIEDQVATVKEYASSALRQLLSVYLYDFNNFSEERDIESLKNKFSQWGLSTLWLGKCIGENTHNGVIGKKIEDDLRQWLDFDIGARSNQLLTVDEKGIRTALLMGIDHVWQGFLESCSSIRDGVHLRAYANEKPDLVFKKEVFNLFMTLYKDLPVVMMDFYFAALRQTEIEMDEASVAS